MPVPIAVLYIILVALGISIIGGFCGAIAYRKMYPYSPQVVIVDTGIPKRIVLAEGDTVGSVRTNSSVTFCPPVPAYLIQQGGSCIRLEKVPAETEAP